MSKILVLTGNYHFGDNIGIFQDAVYIGHTLSIPLNITWINSDEDLVYFIFSTHDVETWGDWLGHKVLLQGNEIGRIKDPNDKFGYNEVFEIQIKRDDFISMLPADHNLELTIELDRQISNPSFCDDFVLTRIETKNISASIGWKAK